jgi:DNA polymerase elongation subunit (family B)
MWIRNEPVCDDTRVEALAGGGELAKLATFGSLSSYKQASSDRSLEAENIRPLEAQYLMAGRRRFFDGMAFTLLRRCTLEVELECGGEEPDGMNEAHRIVAACLIGPDGARHTFASGEGGDRATAAGLARLVGELDPDVVEGHGVHAMLDFLIAKMRRLRVPQTLGRFGAKAASRKSRLRIAERWIDYPRSDLPGRSVFDSSIAIQIYDIGGRDLPGYELEEVADYFGIPCEGCSAQEASAVAAGRAALARAVADRLLPTYFAQAQAIPLPLQEVCLRGSSAKVDALLFERYLHARHALPGYPPGAPFEGALSQSYQTGTFHDVVHFDVASLYPSLLMHMGRAPAGDELNVFIPLLGELRTLRLEFKKLAKDAPEGALRDQYNARQQSFKILINSFYGYLGFPQARFADPALAGEVTRRGRELLQSLVERFKALGCLVLEADTDGIYLAAGEYSHAPESLLEKTRDLLPAGVSLEYDGSYEAMFCYKAKNYALLEDGRLVVRGSALRSRGMEPFLGELTRELLLWKLGARREPLDALVSQWRERIASGTADIASLAKGEYLSMSPAAYKKKIDEGGKPRRASLEVALRLRPTPRMGERVLFYMAPKAKGQAADWQRARGVGEADRVPYCPAYYLGRLDDWLERYAEHLGGAGGRQDEMPFA